MIHSPGARLASACRHPLERGLLARQIVKLHLMQCLALSTCQWMCASVMPGTTCRPFRLCWIVPALASARISSSLPEATIRSPLIASAETERMRIVERANVSVIEDAIDQGIVS